MILIRVGQGAELGSSLNRNNRRRATKQAQRVGLIDKDVTRLKRRVAFVIACGDNRERMPLSGLRRWDCVKASVLWWDGLGRHESKKYAKERGLNTAERGAPSGIWDGVKWDDLTKVEKIKLATQWYVQKYLHDEGILIEEHGTANS